MAHSRAELVTVFAIVTVAFFFLSPTIYWFTAYSPTLVPTSQAHRPLFWVYRSPSCVVFGIGLSAVITARDHASSEIRYTCRAPALPLISPLMPMAPLVS